MDVGRPREQQRLAPSVLKICRPGHEIRCRADFRYPGTTQGWDSRAIWCTVTSCPTPRCRVDGNDSSFGSRGAFPTGSIDAGSGSRESERILDQTGRLRMPRRRWRDTETRWMDLFTIFGPSACPFVAHVVMRFAAHGHPIDAARRLPAAAIDRKAWYEALVW